MIREAVALGYRDVVQLHDPRMGDVANLADFRQLVANVMLGQMIAELEQVAARELPDADALPVASARGVAELLRAEASLLIRGSIQPLQPPAENFDAFNQDTRKPIDRTQ